MKELTQSCEEGIKPCENNNETIIIKVSDKETSFRTVNNTMRELTQSCVLTVDTFSEDTSNILSYPDPVQSFEDICNGIKKELYSEVVKKVKQNCLIQLMMFVLKEQLLLQERKEWIYLKRKG